MAYVNGGWPEEWQQEVQERNERDAKISSLKIKIEQLRKQSDALWTKLQQDPDDEVAAMEKAVVELEIEQATVLLRSLLESKLEVARADTESKILEVQFATLEEKSDRLAERQSYTYWLPWARTEQERLKRESARLDRQTSTMMPQLTARMDTIRATAAASAMSRTRASTTQFHAATVPAAAQTAPTAVSSLHLAPSKRHDA